MKINSSYLYLIMGMCLVTYLPRMLPATLLSKRKIHKVLIRFLSFIPVAVLSALLFPAVFMVNNRISISWSNHVFIAALFTFPLAYKTKNMFLTVLMGMAIVIILNSFL
ncbi:MAG: AzlD domain-containing protein [Tepidanaerobacteraceae bacterium]|jgi:branched-subunit amino acid transport protein|nr:AzlD domain-containing protein [Thermoanaerobacterales bacterium]